MVAASFGEIPVCIDRRHEFESKGGACWIPLRGGSHPAAKEFSIFLCYRSFRDEAVHELVDFPKRTLRFGAEKCYLWWQIDDAREVHFREEGCWFPTFMFVGGVAVECGASHGVVGEADLLPCPCVHAGEDNRVGVSELSSVPTERDDFSSHGCWCVEVHTATKAVDGVKERGASLDHSKDLEFRAVREDLVLELVLVVLSCLGLPREFLFRGIGCVA